MLLICTPCNRQKGAQFDLDVDGRAVLIDPTVDDPWDFLHYEAQTGIITARYDSTSGLPSPKGIYTTLESFTAQHSSNHQGRQRTHRHLRRAVNAFRSAAEQGKDIDEAKTELLSAIHDNNAYGLTHWFFLREGKTDSPFSALMMEFPAIWQSIVDMI